MPDRDETRDETRDQDPPTASHLPVADLTHSGPVDPPTGSGRDPVDPAAAPAIPGYEILEEIGRGGMGVVYRARQLGLNREVAVKTVLGATVSGTAAARFWAEAEVMAAVRHPHVVRVHELGEADGRPFIAMELVAGGSLADRLAAGPMPARAAAGLMEKVARGVAAAHELGIVHRDLKPGNVLLDAAGEPTVADFGLAKWAASDLTRTQVVMGTPAYMAPEQAAGRAKFVGPAADVWALGVILYECVAGERPFDADAAAELLSRIRSAEPTPLRRVRGAPRDLDTVVSKCLAKEPEHRYPTAAELADDLGRFLRGEPIAARPVGPVERFARWVRRKPTAAAAYGFSALAALLALVVFVVFGFWRDAAAARDEADRLRGVADAALAKEAAARKDVERERAKLARLEYARTIQFADQQLRGDNVPAALALLDSTRADLRGWEWHHLRRYCQFDLVSFRVNDGRVVSAALSPDGTRVLICQDGAARVWDARTGAELLALKEQRAGSAAFGPDGTRILTTSSDGPVRVWDARTGAELLSLGRAGERVESAAFSPDGTRVVAFLSSRRLEEWELLEKRLLDWDHTATTWLEWEHMTTARAWDATTGAELVTLKVPASNLHFAAFSPDGTRVLATCRSGDSGEGAPSQVLDARTGATLLTLGGDKKAVDSAAFSPDGTRILTTSYGDPVRVWDATTGTQLFAVGGQRADSAAFSPDGTRILTTSYGDPVRVWDARTGAELVTLKRREGSPGALSARFSPDGTRILTTGGHAARVWDARTGAELLALNGHTGAVNSASFSPDGTRILTTASDGTARVWDAHGGPGVSVLRGGGEGVLAIDFSPDGSRILTTCDDETVRVWDARTATQILVLRGHDRPVQSAHFSPDGSHILTRSGNRSGRPRVWDATTGAEVLDVTPFAPRDRFSPHTPDGSRVVTFWGGTVRVADNLTAADLIDLGWGGSAAFSPDGTRIVIRSNNTALLWDSRPFRETRPPDREPEPGPMPRPVEK